MQNYLFLAQQQTYPPKHENLPNAGSWSLQQNLSYAIFIDIHKKSMTSKKKMREMQFYDKLAAFIATRSASQCRSHHQKLFDKFKYISKIVELFKNEVGLPSYKAEYFEGTEKMKAIDLRFASNAPTDASNAEQNVELPLHRPPEADNTFLIGVNMLPFPVFFNSLYYFGEVPGVVGLQTQAGGSN